MDIFEKHPRYHIRRMKWDLRRRMKTTNLRARVRERVKLRRDTLNRFGLYDRPRIGIE